MSGKLVTLRHSREEFRSIFAVNWTLNNVCNYSCSYCHPNLYDGSFKGVNLLLMIRFIHQVFEQKKNKKIYFEFTGGEVTYYPDFPVLLNFIKDKGGLTGVISNGSRTLSWWKENSHLMDHVCMSFHPERGDQEEFLEVLKYLTPLITLHVNVMMKPENFNELYQYARRLVKELPGISVSIQPLFEKFSGPPYEYTDSQWTVLRNPELPYTTPARGMIMRGAMESLDQNGVTEIVDPSLLISGFQNRWKGWMCEAGVENIAVNMNGDIYRGLCQAGGPIGNLQENTFKLPEIGIICPREMCSCAFDVMSTKVSKL